MQKFLTVGVDKSGTRRILVGADQPYNKHKLAMAEAKVNPLPKGTVLIEQYVMSRATSGIDAKAQKTRLDGGLVPDDGRGLKGVEAEAEAPAPAETSEAPAVVEAAK